jgi:hypothetical protein
LAEGGEYHLTAGGRLRREAVPRRARLGAQWDWVYISCQE